MNTQSYSRKLSIQDGYGETIIRLTFKSIQARERYDALLNELVTSGDLLNVEDVDYTLCLSEWAERNELPMQRAKEFIRDGRIHGAKQLGNGAWVVPITAGKPEKLPTGYKAHKKKVAP